MGGVPSAVETESQLHSSGADHVSTADVKNSVLPLPVRADSPSEGSRQTDSAAVLSRVRGAVRIVTKKKMLTTNRAIMRVLPFIVLLFHSVLAAKKFSVGEHV